MAGSRLAKLLAHRQAVEAQIQQEKARQRSRDRKEDTRRKVLAGAVVFEHAEHDAGFKATLDALLAKMLTRPNDRELFGLAPLPEPANQEAPPLHLVASASSEAKAAK